MTTPEWLRPVSERYLGGEDQTTPWTVWAATVLCAVCALVAGGMAVTWGAMTVRISQHPPVHLLTWLATVLLALTGLVLLAVFAPSVVMLRRRGWFRLPIVAGLVLGGIALVGLCVAAEPVTELPQRETDRAVRDWQATAVVVPQLVVTAAAAFGMVLLLRTGSASSWLATRRYRHRRPASET